MLHSTLGAVTALCERGCCVCGFHLLLRCGRSSFMEIGTQPIDTSAMRISYGRQGREIRLVEAGNLDIGGWKLLPQDDSNGGCQSMALLYRFDTPDKSRVPIENPGGGIVWRILL